MTRCAAPVSTMAMMRTRRNCMLRQYRRAWPGHGRRSSPSSTSTAIRPISGFSTMAVVVDIACSCSQRVTYFHCIPPVGRLASCQINLVFLVAKVLRGTAHAHRRAARDQTRRVPRGHAAGRRRGTDARRPHGAGRSRGRAGQRHRRCGVCRRRGRDRRHGRRDLRPGRPDRQGEGAAAAGVAADSPRADALHLLPLRRRPRADRGDARTAARPASPTRRSATPRAACRC